MEKLIHGKLVVVDDPFGIDQMLPEGIAKGSVIGRSYCLSRKRYVRISAPGIR